MDLKRLREFTHLKVWFCGAFPNFVAQFQILFACLKADRHLLADSLRSGTRDQTNSFLPTIPGVGRLIEQPQRRLDLR